MEVNVAQLSDDLLELNLDELDNEVKFHFTRYHLSFCSIILIVYLDCSHSNEPNSYAKLSYRAVSTMNPSQKILQHIFVAFSSLTLTLVDITAHDDININIIVSSWARHDRQIKFEKNSCAHCSEIGCNLRF